MSYTKTTVTPTTAGTLWIGDTAVEVPWGTLADHTISTAGTVSVPFTSVSPPKGRVLTAKARLNKGTMQAYGNEHAMQVVKHRLVKDLLEQLINSGVVKITSDISRTGAATFTATVVCNEAA